MSSKDDLNPEKISGFEGEGDIFSPDTWLKKLKKNRQMPNDIDTEAEVDQQIQQEAERERETAGKVSPAVKSESAASDNKSQILEREKEESNMEDSAISKKEETKVQNEQISEERSNETVKSTMNFEEISNQAYTSDDDSMKGDAENSVTTAVEEPEVTEDTGEEMSDDDLMALELEKTFVNIEPGSIITGSVISVTKEEVILDIHYKSEGAVPFEEFAKNSEDINIKQGDEFSVMVLSLDDGDGRVRLSKSQADQNLAWDMVFKAHSDNLTIEGFTRKAIKGGMLVDINGINAFMPFSQIGLAPRQDAESMVGCTISLKVIEVHKKQNRVVVSRRKALDEERAVMRQETFSELAEGAIRTARVVRINKEGAVLDMDGVRAVISLEDISWSPLRHPGEAIKSGDEVDVKILEMPEKEDAPVKVGIKQITKDPWLFVFNKYPVGSVLKVKIKKLATFGAFAELDKGVEGLIHVSELAWNKRVNHPKEVLTVDERVMARIISIDEENKKIGLSIKQAQESPWDLFAREHPEGSVIEEGIVRGITDFGVFVEVSAGLQGLVHVSDLTWSKKKTDPKDVVKTGDKINVKVLKIDSKKQKISLGLKQTTDDPWTTFCNSHKDGDIVEGRISDVTDFGAFLEVSDGVDGLIHLSQLTDKRNVAPKEIVSPGQTVKVKIKKILKGQRRLELSYREYKEDIEKADLDKYINNQDAKLTTMGDLLNHAMKQQENNS